MIDFSAAVSHSLWRSCVSRRFGCAVLSFCAHMASHLHRCLCCAPVDLTPFMRCLHNQETFSICSSECVFLVAIAGSDSGVDYAVQRQVRLQCDLVHLSSAYDCSGQLSWSSNTASAVTGWITWSWLWCLAHFLTCACWSTSRTCPSWMTRLLAPASCAF